MHHLVTEWVTLPALFTWLGETQALALISTRSSLWNLHPSFLKLGSCPLRRLDSGPARGLRGRRQNNSRDRPGRLGSRCHRRVTDGLAGPAKAASKIEISRGGNTVKKVLCVFTLAWY